MSEPLFQDEEEEEELLTSSQYSYVMNYIKDIDLALMQTDELPVLEGLSEELKIYSPESEYPTGNTCDIDNQCDSAINETNLGLPPVCHSFDGNYDFQLIVPSDSTQKRIYSTKLEKLFIDVGTDIALRFKWNYCPGNKQLYVRAAPTYTKDEYVDIPVKRCPLHMMPDNPLNAGFNFLEHVIRCENENTKYEKHPDSGRLCCVTPLGLPQPGVDYVTFKYKFLCYSLCREGMDNRSIAVVFTLEDEGGLVNGKQCLNVRVCSTPTHEIQKEEGKREMEGEEDLFNHKNTKKSKKEDEEKTLIKNKEDESEQK